MWIVKQWIKEKLGIRPSDILYQRDREIGKAICEGMKAGLESKPSMIIRDIKIDGPIPDGKWHKGFAQLLTHDMNFEPIGQSGHVHNVQKDDRTVTEPLIQEFAKKVNDQQEKVLASGKYEHPVHRTNHTALEWIGHAEDEFADLGVYLQCTKQTIREVITDLELIQVINEDETVDRMIQKVIARLK